MNGVKHILCTPYHPSSNGLVERFVKTFKRAMKSGESSGTPLSQRLYSFLLSYRSTPRTTTNCTPSSMFLQRELRTRLDLVRPSSENEVLTHQAYQVQGKDRHACVREFQEGEKVMVKNYRS